MWIFQIAPEKKLTSHKPMIEQKLAGKLQANKPPPHPLVTAWAGGGGEGGGQSF